MDAFTLVAHCIWASVLAGGFGVCLIVWRSSMLDDAAKSRLYLAELALHTDRSNIEGLTRDVATIRDGLEKLKAIPPRKVNY
jgi:hypothetical protein